MMSIAFSKRILLLDSGWVGISQSQVGGKPSLFFCDGSGQGWVGS